MPTHRAVAFALALLPVATLAAHAQTTSIYATVGITENGYSVDSSSIGYKNTTGGFILGGFYNFPIQSRLTAGIDLRLIESPGAKGGTAVTTAFRIAFVPKENRLRPYFELGGGVVSTPTNYTNTTIPNTRHTGGALELDFGLDIRINDHIDFRAIDYGAAAGGAAGVGFLTTGVVYHFPKK